MNENKVGIIGGGIAGLETALKLEKKGFQITLYDPRTELMFYPASHKVMEGYNPDKISINYKNKFQDRNIKHIQKEVQEINPNDKKVAGENFEDTFDYIIIAVGAETNYFGLEQKNTETLKYRDDLCEIREEILGEKLDNVLVVGGGATGVEASSALQVAREQKQSDFEITLIEANNRILTRQSEKMGKKVEKTLKSNNVNLELNKSVKTIKDDSVVTESGEEYAADEVIWAGGLKKHPLIENSNLPQDKKGVKVDEKQRVEGFKNVFAVGDCTSYNKSQSRALYALFEAKTAAKNIVKTSKNKSLVSRSIPYDPILIYLGKYNSAFEFKNIVFTGLIPSLMEKIGVEKRYLWTRKHIF